jgi:hypothetical protein
VASGDQFDAIALARAQLAEMTNPELAAMAERRRVLDRNLIHQGRCPSTTAITLDGPVTDPDDPRFWMAENWPQHRAPARYWVIDGWAKAELWVPTWVCAAPHDLWWGSCPIGIAVDQEWGLGWAMKQAQSLEHERDEDMIALGWPRELMP